MFISVLTAHLFCAYIDTISAFYECKLYFMCRTKKCPILNEQTSFPFDICGKKSTLCRYLNILSRWPECHVSLYLIQISPCRGDKNIAHTGLWTTYSLINACNASGILSRQVSIVNRSQQDTSVLELHLQWKHKPWHINISIEQPRHNIEDYAEINFG